MADYTLSAKITGDASGFEKAFSTAEKSAASFESKMKSISARVNAVGDKISSFGTKMTAVSVGLGAAATAGVKYNGTVEQLQTSFEVMTGSADQAADIVDRLKKIGASTPFEFTDLADTTQLLMNFGFTADGAIDSMQMLGDISQGSAEKMSSIARAYGKMSSAGKVSLEDINMMIDAGFNPLQEISQSTGESMADLYDRISDGAMSVDEITASMQRSTSEGGKYFQSMQKQSQTFNGQMSTLSDNVNGFLGNITEGIFDNLAQNVLPKVNDTISTVNDAFESGGFQGAVDAVKEMNPVLDKVISTAESGAKVLQSFGIDTAMFVAMTAAVGPALIAIGKMTSVTGGLIGIVGKLGGVIGMLPGPAGIVVAAITALITAFAYLMTTNDGFRNSIMASVQQISTAVMPVIQLLVSSLLQIAQAVIPVVIVAMQSIAPIITQVVSLAVQVITVLAQIVTQVISALMPVITQIIVIVGQVISIVGQAVSQLVSDLSPVIIQVISIVQNIISAILPSLISILNTVIGVIQAILPVMQAVLQKAMDVIAQIIAKVSPIASFIGDILAQIFAKVSEIFANIVQKTGDVISNISEIISRVKAVASDVFEAVWDTVSSVMQRVGNFISGVFNKIESAWNGLTSFVGGVFDGIGSAVNSLVDSVRGFVNGVIGGINGAVGVINKIPGVSIGYIPYLLHGTDNWQGGFARMNEGGRGELTYLPDGSQVIPHDISVRYAKESARVNATAEPLDMSGLMEGMVIQIVNNTSVDGTPLKEAAADYTIRRINKTQYAAQRVRGVYA